MSRHSELERLLPKILPAHWMKERVMLMDHPAIFFYHTFGLKVLVSIDGLEDKHHWLHLSVSRPDRIPSWDDIHEVKNIFIGSEQVAIQLLPKESEYINVQPNTMHLWHCIDGETTRPWG